MQVVIGITEHHKRLLIHADQPADKYDHLFPLTVLRHDDNDQMVCLYVIEKNWEGIDEVAYSHESLLIIKDI